MVKRAKTRFASFARYRGIYVPLFVSLRSVQSQRPPDVVNRSVLNRRHWRLEPSPMVYPFSDNSLFQTCDLCYFFYLLLSFTTFSIFCCFSIFLCLFLSFLSSSIFQPSQPLLHPSSAVFPVCLREFHPAAVRLLLFSRDIPDPF